MVASGIDRNNLVLAAQTGDPTAITRLLAVCQADARRYAYKHCQASDIDDAVQESLMVIARKVKGLKAAAAFSSWLFTVIKRECRKLERAIRQGQAIPDAKLAALYALTQEMVRTNGRPNQDKVAACLDAGYQETHILYIVLAIAVKVLSNFSNHAFGTELDTRFAAYKVV